MPLLEAPALASNAIHAGACADKPQARDEGKTRPHIILRNLTTKEGQVGWVG